MMWDFGDETTPKEREEERLEWLKSEKKARLYHNKIVNFFKLEISSLENAKKYAENLLDFFAKEISKRRAS